MNEIYVLLSRAKRVTLYRSKFIFFDLYVIPQGRNSLGGGAARAGGADPLRAISS